APVTPPARAPAASPPATPLARTEERAPTPPVGADRIGAGPRDPRLWRLPETVRPVDLTSEDIRRIELLAALSQLGDSLASARLAELARFDWTVRDAEGGRWGVTPGWLHLGGISIPLPLNFATPTLGTGAEGRAADWAAIQEQARRLGTDAELQERIRALRERKAAEREKGRSGNGGP
ncbi:MAG TPA: hypothetical protein VMK65_12630, partial [Longimicrobiales bacterium]|nr:hypothetical protein [Longimicrobiales bacterium]